MLYEVRDYHYRPDLFDEYQQWADRAVPVLRDLLDVVGFWVDSGEASEVGGTDPIDSPIGHANVTWIIRWEDMQDREENLPKALGSQAWRDIWAEHPDPGGYLQLMSRFMDAK
jgi:hypothetical protein